jgi:hypothetical protein
MKRIAAFLFLFLAACGRSEVTAEDAEKVLRETLSAVKQKEVVRIVVRLEKTEMPSAEELELRRKIEEAIDKEGVGQLKVADAGVGYFEINVEVESSAEAVPRIRDLLETFGVLERSTVRIVQQGR